MENVLKNVLTELMNVKAHVEIATKTVKHVLDLE